LECTAAIHTGFEDSRIRYRGLQKICRLVVRRPAPPDGLQYTTHQRNDWRAVIISGRSQKHAGSSLGGYATEASSPAPNWRAGFSDRIPSDDSPGAFFALPLPAG
jgi:hypothetical protein